MGLHGNCLTTITMITTQSHSHGDLRAWPSGVACLHACACCTAAPVCSCPVPHLHAVPAALAHGSGSLPSLPITWMAADLRGVHVDLCGQRV